MRKDRPQEKLLSAAVGGVMGRQLQTVGPGLALGVLLDTFGVRTLLVPIVVLLSRRNRWPSRLGQPASAPHGGPPPHGEPHPGLGGS